MVDLEILEKNGEIWGKQQNGKWKVFPKKNKKNFRNFLRKIE